MGSIEPKNDSKPSKISSTTVMASPDDAITIIPTSSLSKSGEWPQLHALINAAYIPPAGHEANWPLSQPFYRLHPNADEAWDQFHRELGPHAIIALYNVPNPDPSAPPRPAASPPTAIAAAAALMPTASPAATPHAPSPPPAPAAPPHWEFNFVATGAGHRRQGLSSALVARLEAYAAAAAKAGEARLVVRTVDDLAGAFWRARGYAEDPELCVMLPSGFTHLPGFNGLPREVWLWGGAKAVGGESCWSH